MGKDCKEKKCKKNCQSFTYYFDSATTVRANPVPDVYTALGGNQSYSLFSYNSIYTDSQLTNKLATIESNSKVIQNNLINPPLLPQVVSDQTAFLNDGVSSISFKYFYTSNSPLPVPVPGVYKAVAYNSTGVYLDKNCYINITVPSSGSVYTIELKVCNRKSCA